MEEKKQEQTVIRINLQKNLGFYLKKCRQEFDKHQIVHIHAIGNATGMLVKVCEGMQRIHGSTIKRLESVGFYDRKQYKKRKLKLVAVLEKGPKLINEELVGIEAKRNEKKTESELKIQITGKAHNSEEKTI